MKTGPRWGTPKAVQSTPWSSPVEILFIPEKLAVAKLNFRTRHISLIHQVFTYKCRQGKLIKFRCKSISVSNWQKGQ